MIRRLLAVVVVAAVGATAGLVATPPPPAAAVGAGDIVGEYVVRLRGDGFDRSATSGRVDEGAVRGRAVVTVTRAAQDGDPRDVLVRVTLESALTGSLLDRATPTPALQGRGILVGDSLTVIGAGQANFVNAVTMRFQKNGRKVEGWWLASFPGSTVDDGFVAGVGLSFRGKRLRKGQASPAPAATTAPR